jgi:1-acyl-sn-glycerol-3-phosphate acyltransferase
MAAPALRQNQPELSRLERLIHWLLVQWFQRLGWRADGVLPPDPKFVIMAASHTSNWDFLVFLGTIHALGRPVHFIGKHSLFKWPMGSFMRALGGVPVDRSARQDLVGQVADEFARRDKFLLVIAPEGTRSANAQWKTGFYQIALKAGVPILCAGPDYPTKRGVIGPLIHPTGNYAEDLRPAFAFFRTLTPKHPERGLFPEGS